MPERAARRGSSVKPPVMSEADQADLFEVAYKEGIRAIESQASELENLRSKVVAFAGFVGAAAAFLVGSGLANTEAHAKLRDGWFYGIAVTASVLALAWLTFTLLTLKFVQNWKQKISSKDLIAQTLRREVPPATKAKFFEELAEAYDTTRANNERELESVRDYFLWAVGLGVFQLLLWIALVWAKG